MQQQPQQQGYPQQPYAQQQQHQGYAQQAGYAQAQGAQPGAHYPAPPTHQQYASPPGQQQNAIVASTGSWTRAAGIMHLVLGAPALIAGATFVGGPMGTIQFVVGAGLCAVGASLLTAGGGLTKAAKAQSFDALATMHALASYRRVGMAQVAMLAALVLLTGLVLGGYR